MLVTLLGKYGYNDALTIENNNVTINTNGETETLTWDSAAMDFTVDVEMFVNGSQNMFFRTVNDGSRDVTVLCDADGKAIQVPSLGDNTNVLFSVANNGTEIDTITSGDTISREGVLNACGGYVNVSALDAGAAVFLLVKGSHVQFCNGVDLTTTPSVIEMPLTPLKIRHIEFTGNSYDVVVNAVGSVLIDSTRSKDGIRKIPETGKFVIAGEIGYGFGNLFPTVECRISTTVQGGYDFDFEYQGQTWNVVDGVCTPDITES